MKIDLINDETDELFETVELDDDLAQTLEESAILAKMTLDEYVIFILDEGFKMLLDEGDDQ
jgi:hypothetical protein